MAKHTQCIAPQHYCLNKHSPGSNTTHGTMKPPPSTNLNSNAKVKEKTFITLTIPSTSLTLLLNIL